MAGTPSTKSTRTRTGNPGRARKTPRSPWVRRWTSCARIWSTTSVRWSRVVGLCRPCAGPGTSRHRVAILGGESRGRPCSELGLGRPRRDVGICIWYSNPGLCPKRGPGSREHTAVARGWCPWGLDFRATCPYNGDIGNALRYLGIQGCAPIDADGLARHNIAQEDCWRQSAAAGEWAAVCILGLKGRRQGGTSVLSNYGDLPASIRVCQEGRLP